METHFFHNWIVRWQLCERKRAFSPRCDLNETGKPRAMCRESGDDVSVCQSPQIIACFMGGVPVPAVEHKTHLVFFDFSNQIIRLPHCVNETMALTPELWTWRR